MVVHRQPEARNGDIVVARPGQEVTLKRYEQVDAHRVELQHVSTNPEHRTSVVRAILDRRDATGARNPIQHPTGARGRRGIAIHLRIEHVDGRTCAR